MSVILSIINLDHQIFHLINSEWTSQVLDYILPVWRDKLFWLPVYFFIVSFMVLNFKMKGYWYVLFMVLTVGAADIASSKIVKPSVERLRPCRDPGIGDERVLVRCGSGYSFTSSHAANHFAISMFLIFTVGRRKQWRWVVPATLFWAASVAYGQVYVGVHYPLDIIAGAILGGLIAYLGSYCYSKSGHRYINWSAESLP